MPILRSRQLMTKGNISDSLLIDSNPWKSEGIYGQHVKDFIDNMVKYFYLIKFVRKLPER